MVKHAPLMKPAAPAPTNDWYRACWHRLYAQARMRGCDAHGAEDVVQDVFATLARRGRLDALGQQPQEARHGLLAKCLRNRIARNHRDLRRLKRGGNVIFVSLDDPAEQRLEIADERARNHGPADEPTALDQALQALRRELKPDTWRLLSCVLIDGEKPARFSVAQRVALHRARQRLRHLLRQSQRRQESSGGAAGGAGADLDLPVPGRALRKK